MPLLQRRRTLSGPAQRGCTSQYCTLEKNDGVFGLVRSASWITPGCIQSSVQQNAPKGNCTVRAHVGVHQHGPYEPYCTVTDLCDDVTGKECTYVRPKSGFGTDGMLSVCFLEFANNRVRRRVLFNWKFTRKVVRGRNGNKQGGVL
jgi:hypothetical protein